MKVICQVNMFRYISYDGHATELLPEGGVSRIRLWASGQDVTAPEHRVAAQRPRQSGRGRAEGISAAPYNVRHDVAAAVARVLHLYGHAEGEVHGASHQVSAGLLGRGQVDVTRTETAELFGSLPKVGEMSHSLWRTATELEVITTL